MLPNTLIPNGTYELIRLGRNNDEGYLVDPESVKKAKTLISYGLSTDWSFEKDFLKINRVPVAAYDPTVNARFWKQLLIRRLFHPKIWKWLIDYKLFFRSSNHHYKEWIGNLKDHTNIQKTLSRQNKQPVFLSIDIEGGEYRILDDLIAVADQLCGLAIEFHDTDLHQERIIQFIKHFPLTLIHIHGNNNAPLDQNGSPNVFEMTFSKNPKKIKNEPSIPHPLDQRCMPKKPEKPLVFEQSSHQEGL